MSKFTTVLEDIDPSGRQWLLLMEKKTIFLFPFWRYFETLYQNIYLNLNKIQHGITDRSLKLKIISHMELLVLELVKRVLSWEFNLSRRKKKINFEDFIVNISSENQLCVLFKKYPVLYFLINRIVRNYNKYVAELINRLHTDLTELIDFFELHGFILHSFILKGDSHCLGARVTEIIFHNSINNQIKKIIYKPREITLELKFNYLIKFISFKNNKITLKPIMILSKSSYGWIEYIHYDYVDDLGANKYYFNYGALLGICYILNAQDMHYENIIARGTHPTVVDLECLCSPPITQKQYEDKNFPSIFDTLLIPFTKNKWDREYDISALLNHSKQKTIVSKFEINGDFNEKIVIERKHLHIVPSKNYLINKFTMRPFNPYVFSKDLISGFYYLLQYVFNNKNDFIKLVIGELSNIKCRIIFRPTFIYSKILIESYHPVLLADKNKYFEYLSQLNKDGDDGIYRKIYDSEVFDLINGDIPYFSASTSSVDIKNSQENKINHSCYDTGLERIVNKISMLDNQKIEKMAHMILVSLEEHYG